MPSAFPENSSRVSDIAVTRTAWALIAAFFAFMVWFGATYHPIEEVNSGEWDNYVAQVDEIRHGQLPDDPYRPRLYPLTAAAFAQLFGDSFVGARFTSSLFAVIFVLSAFLVGRRVYSSRAGLFAAAAMMLNHNVLRYGVHTTTDMMFAGLAGMTVFFAVRAVRDTRTTSMIPLALGFALAYFTRYTAVALLPCVVVAVFGPGGERSWSRTALRALVFALGATVFLLPHFILTYQTYGSPLYNENWRNLAFKLYGNWDWQYLNQNPFDGMWSVIAHEPLRFISATARETVKFGYVTMMALGGYAVAGGLFTASALAGVYHAATAADRQRVVLLAFLAGYVLTICAFFYTTPRFMLPVIPVCYVLAAAWLLNAAFPGTLTIRGRAWPRSVPVVAVFLLIGLAATLREMPFFIASHPIEELHALERLEQKYGHEITVLGTGPCFERHLAFRYRVLKILEQTGNDEDFYAQMSLPAKDADFVVIGRLTARGCPPGLVNATSAPPFLDLIEANPSVAVYRVRKTAIQTAP